FFVLWFILMLVIFQVGCGQQVPQLNTISAPPSGLVLRGTVYPYFWSGDTFNVGDPFPGAYVKLSGSTGTWSTITNERGEYIPIEEVKIGIFKEFIRIGRLIFPRYIFYAVLFTTMLLSYIIIYQQNFSPHNIMALIFGFLACIILWYETLRLLKETPI
ncbi:MAG: hypothetical protein QW303_04105, partial [Nitrososphaerota archaeon]